MRSKVYVGQVRTLAAVYRSRAERMLKVADEKGNDDAHWRRAKADAYGGFALALEKLIVRTP